MPRQRTLNSVLKDYPKEVILNDGTGVTRWRSTRQRDKVECLRERGDDKDPNRSKEQQLGARNVRCGSLAEVPSTNR